MGKSLKIILLFCTLILIAAGCTAPGKKPAHILKKEMGKKVLHKTITIKPARSYEECIELMPGMVIDYDFDASDFVNFNIHYHAEDSVHYPARRKGVKMSKGLIDPGKHDFYTEEQEFYCLMWDNINDEPVKVSFNCTLRMKDKVNKMHH